MNRSKRVCVLTLVLAGLGSSPAHSQDAAKSTEPPKPAAELSQLKFFAGTWSCSGKAFASPMGPEHKNQGTARVKLDIGGFWYSVSYEEKRTKENPIPVKIGAYWGYDAGQKKLAAGTVDSFGGYSIQYAPGWEGSKLIWSGDSLGGPAKMSSRDTFTKKGENEMTHAGEIGTPDGKWMQTDEETCKRATAAPAK